MKKKRRLRSWVQLLATFATNGHLIGFLNGKISQSPLKAGCVPGLNCYSCPGAVASCPIGSLQAVIGGRKHQFSFYVVGILLFFGLFLGRAICGFLCPFGFLQDLLYKTPLPKLRVPKKADRPLRFLKYAMLAFAVILLPMLLTNAFGIAPPYFCKWICPAGTLEGGIPLLIANEGLRKSMGFLFSWKAGLLVLILLSSMTIYRPFCKYICPLGAFYALLNRFSLYHLHYEKASCNQCGACARVCKMNVDVTKHPNATECIRCGDCVHVCPRKAITVVMGKISLAPSELPPKEETI